MRAFQISVLAGSSPCLVATPALRRHDPYASRKPGHDGAMYLGMACQKLVRNLMSQAPDSLEEQDALEKLAMLCQFARLTDATERVTAT